MTAAVRTCGSPMSPSPSRSFTPEQLRALDLLRHGRRFVLVGHVRPDGDCLGAQTALARLLEHGGREVWIINPDPPEERYDYLGDDTTFRTYRGGALPVHDVAVLLDFSELQRTGVLEKPLRDAPSKKLVIDHHLHHGEPWWTEAFVDSSASSTGLLVHRIANALDMPLDRAAARGILTSLVTDTGWFKYSNTDAETLAVASEMVELGANPTEIFGSLYQRRSRGHPAAIGRLLNLAEFFADGRLVVVGDPVTETPERDLADTDEVLDILRSVRSVEVVLYLRELKDGTCKLSARSKSAYDVNALARKFGGGGHRKASGATIKGSLADVRGIVLESALQGFDAPPERALAADHRAQENTDAR